MKIRICNDAYLITFAWFLRAFLFSSSNWRSFSSSSFWRWMMRKKSSRSALAWLAIVDSRSKNWRLRATSSSSACLFAFSLSAISFLRVSRSYSSKARLARRASISDYLSAAFSCISLRRATSLSFSSFCLRSSRACATSRATLSWL